MFSFGYGPAIAEGGEIAWGARGIDDGQSIGLLNDRQTWYLRGAPTSKEATDKDKAALVAFKGVMDPILPGILTTAFTEARARGELDPTKSGEVVLYEDWFIKATANTNMSCGYVYLTVAAKPLPDVPVLRELKDEHKNQDPATWKAPTDYLVWSSDTRPELGSRVCITALAEQPRGTVVGWVHEFGWLRMMVMPDGDDEVINLMGREWEPVEDDQQELNT